MKVASKMNEDNKFKNLNINDKMKLDELLKKTYPPKKRNEKKTELSEVYAIIYRIYCIAENKSYIGQTFSHVYSRNYICKSGILTRCKHHYNDKNLEVNKNKPLYIALTKYSADQFIVYEEEQLFNTSIELINQKEGEYMIKYDTLFPNGYNIEETGKKYSKLLKDLSELHCFKIKKYEYVDKTRTRRIKDICIGKYFGLEKQQLGKEKTLELLKTLKIESVTLVNSNGLRIIVKLKNEKDNIRVYFSGSNDECIEYVKKITDNVVISSSFIGKDCYKYKLKLDKVIEDKDIITTVTGKSYHNNTRDSDTYLIMISGTKNKRVQTLHRISFGGKSMNIKDSYKIGLDFVERLKKELNNSSVKYILENISS
jgi:hypothetical protein